MGIIIQIFGMPLLFCWGNRADQADVIGRIQPCSEHNINMAFVCLECSNNQLFCNECIDAHRNHKFQKISTYFSEDVCRVILGGSSKTHQELDSLNSKVGVFLQDSVKRYIKKIYQIKDAFSKNVEEIKIKYQSKLDLGDGSINNKNFSEIQRLYENEKKSEWVINMDNFLYKMIGKSDESISNILEDVSNSLILQRWEDLDFVSGENAYKAYLNHLHDHAEPDPQYFKFDETNKHANIRLSIDKLEATYIRSMPSKPVAICKNPITSTNRKFSFEIVKLDSKAIFFSSTTIFIGVCLPSYVKAASFRKINEASKGSYLIGSTGWSYHHNDPKYDRADNVEWGFAQGDRIIVEIEIQDGGLIKFAKYGKLFNNNFQMPLNLKTHQIKELRPCVSFDAQEGAIVKIHTID